MEQICTFLLLFLTGMFIVFCIQKDHQMENRTSLPLDGILNAEPTKRGYNLFAGKSLRKEFQF
jgi:hypothetical protein